MSKPKTEYRVHIKFQTGRDKSFTKRSYEHALADVEKLLEQRNRGGLAPYWTAAKISIQSREVSQWVTASPE